MKCIRRAIKLFNVNIYIYSKLGNILWYLETVQNYKDKNKNIYEPFCTNKHKIKVEV